MGGNSHVVKSFEDMEDEEVVVTPVTEEVVPEKEITSADAEQAE